MENILPLEECSINKIYFESQEKCIYKIPIYQRNYAWEEDEITALIKDVYDSLHKDKKAPYYIGTLVTYKRGDNEYEVIDGQQRLTTIYIILKALGIDNISNKLTYSARKISADTIEKMPLWGDYADKGITNGFMYAKKALETIINEDELKVFEYYFLNNVHIIHYKVPKDVDLNHYFEVMNSRGEQLEKHEIVKSTLSQSIKNKSDLATFSRIWEACSEMNVYIQQVLNEETDIFGKNMYDFIIDGFDKIPKQDYDAGKQTILDLLNNTSERIDFNKDIFKNDKFQPIIDFPNLLLIVLKITLLHDYKDCKYKDLILDDKELLNEFTEVLQCIDDKEKFAKLFIFNLLKAKYILDNYIVHHVLEGKEQSGDNPWQLQYYYRKINEKYPKNLSDDSYVQKELVHLLSMFEVSFTPKQRKNYLFYCMVYLFDNIYNVQGYLKFLQNLADKYFYDVYLNIDCLNERKQPIPNAFDNQILVDNRVDLDIDSEDICYRLIFEKIYKEGESNIPLFVFNYTDYKLWKKYSDDLRGTRSKKGTKNRSIFFEELGCSDFELEPFQNFYFSRTRKSLEHYYPQAKAIKDVEQIKGSLNVLQINCFGNFAMIGAEANSSGSNWCPKTKLDHYSDDKSDPISVASLKFKIMMQICQDNYKDMLNGNLDREKDMEWNYEDIKKHQKKMLDIILS